MRWIRRFGRSWTWLVVAAVVGGAACLPAASEAHSARNGVIGYVLQEPFQTCDQCGPDANSETSGGRTWVETVRPDGKHRLRRSCTSGPFSGCSDRGVAFTPDGQRLAVISDRGLLIMGASGRRLSRLRGVSGTYSLAWDPAGRRIAYTGGAGVQVVDLAGTTRSLSAMDSGGVSWSRRGRLAWDTAFESPASGSIWTSDARGANARRILRRAGRPRWSPSGRRLAFECRKGICLSRPDGTKRRLLTRACAAEPVDELSAPPGFAWAPDGRAIACAGHRGDLIVVHLHPKHVQRVRSSFSFAFGAGLGEIDWQPVPRGR
jgi:WD40 repeat protein